MSISARFLLLCSLLFVFVLGGAQFAQAKLGPISIRAVYTTDESHTNKVVFKPGDPIHYHVDVDNTTGGTFPIDVRFQAFANDYSPDPSLYIYDQTYHVDQMPVGLSRFYTPVTLPSDAKSYFYAARITITPSGCQGTGCTNDGDWGERTFTIQMCTELLPPSSTRSCQPEAKASNLIVLVHGCCTDADGVKTAWGSLRAQIESSIRHPEPWEVVVWDWHEFTPPWWQFAPTPEEGLRLSAKVAYENAKHQGAVLADAIAIHGYKHVHLRVRPETL